MRDEGRALARFVVREMLEPSEAFDRLYATFGPIHARACAFWARAAGADAESEATRLSVFAAIGQIVYFRIARPAVLRRMGWAEIGPAEGNAIKRLVASNLAAGLADAGRREP